MWQKGGGVREKLVSGARDLLAGKGRFYVFEKLKIK